MGISHKDDTDSNHNEAAELGFLIVFDAAKHHVGDFAVINNGKNTGDYYENANEEPSNAKFPFHKQYYILHLNKNLPDGSLDGGAAKTEAFARPIFEMVGICGLEPQTSSLSVTRSNQLSYIPNAK